MKVKKGWFKRVRKIGMIFILAAELCACGERVQNSDELITGVIERVESQDIPEKAEIVLAGIDININEAVKNHVAEYNGEDHPYTIVVKEYNSFESLDADIVSGNIPDILMAKGIPMTSMVGYMNRNLFADVGSLIAEDEELSQKEFMKNVFDAYSVDGRLMYVIPSFKVSTMGARSALVESADGWNMETMRAVLEGMGGEAELICDLTKSGFINYVMRYCGNYLIDEETGKCAFDSPEFITMAEFACTLPDVCVQDFDKYESDNHEYENQYLDEKTLLLDVDIWSFAYVHERLMLLLNGYLGGDYTLCGFPTKNGMGACVSADNLMVLSAESESMDGVWDFVRYYYMDEYQRSLIGSLPICKTILEEWAVDETQRSYLIDENGQKVEYDIQMYSDGELWVVPPLSEDQLEQVLAYVGAVTEVEFEDQEVTDMVEEELWRYFSGEETVEDAVSAVQNRVQAYIQERW